MTQEKSVDGGSFVLQVSTWGRLLLSNRRSGVETALVEE